MLKVENIYLTYTKQYYTLNDLSFSLKNAERVAIVGERDSGKSSFLRALVKLDKCEKGKIFYNEIPLEKVDFSTDVSVGYLPNNFALFEKKSIVDNLKYVLKIRKINKENIEIKILNALNNFDLTKIKSQKVKELSKFERIKVALARLSLRNVEIFLIDNIFNDLDDKELIEVTNLLKSLIKNNNSAAIVMCETRKIAKMFGFKIKKIKMGAIQAG